jgi:transcriptional regulator with XRE-family HTH domain
MGDQGYGARLLFNLTAARQRAGLTVEQLAEASGVGEYERIERGEIAPTFIAVCAVADALGVDLLVLLEGVEGLSPTLERRARPVAWAKRCARRSSHPRRA